MTHRHFSTSTGTHFFCGLVLVTNLHWVTGLSWHWFLVTRFSTGRATGTQTSFSTRLHSSRGTERHLTSCLTGGASGALVGGWAMKKLGLTVQRTILSIMAVQLLNIFCLFTFLLHCPTPPYVGLTLPAGDCAAHCSCPPTSLDPVCGSDGLMYLSPCQAGCSQASSNTNFTDCSCLQDGLATASRRVCEDDCNYFLPMIIVCFISMVLSFLVTLPEIGICQYHISIYYI